MWCLNEKGEKEFKGGQDDWVTAAQEAKACSYFREDVEDEQVANDLRSCYNCRYRRWTVKSFTCSKPG